MPLPNRHFINAFPAARDLLGSVEMDYRPLIAAGQPPVWASRATSTPTKKRRKRGDPPKLHTHDRVKCFILALTQRTLLCAQHAKLFQECGMFLEGEGELGFHHEILDHIRCAPTDKTRRRV